MIARIIDFLTWVIISVALIFVLAGILSPFYGLWDEYLKLISDLIKWLESLAK